MTLLEKILVAYFVIFCVGVAFTLSLCVIANESDLESARLLSSLRRK